MDPVRFSVVVPTADRPEQLRLCLAALAPGRQEGAALAGQGADGLGAISYEVIVTDDRAGAGSGAAGDIDPEWVRRVARPGRGPAANRNHGARQARFEWLAFVDDDCVPGAGWLSGFAGALRDTPDAMVLEGRTVASGERRHILEGAPVNESGGCLWSCNLAVRRDLFLEMGGFDERFPYAGMEDIEFAWRLRARGVGARFVPGATVSHPWRRHASWLRHLRRHLKSQLIMEEIHPGGGFPQPWWRLLARFARRDVTGIIPDIRRYGFGCLLSYPEMVAGQLYEIYVTWRRPSSESIWT